MPFPPVQGLTFGQIHPHNPKPIIMFTAHAFAALLALAAPLIARAAVEPSEPAPGEIFNTGATCHIGWDGTGDANWKGMYIQLMTGDNLNQVALTSECPCSP